MLTSLEDAFASYALSSRPEADTIVLGPVCELKDGIRGQRWWRISHAVGNYSWSRNGVVGWGRSDGGSCSKLAVDGHECNGEVWVL